MPHDRVVAGAQLVECDPKPLAIDLFCGLGGWAEGFLAEGYTVVGFDIEARPYPGSLALQDVLTIHGSQFRNAACLVASPPCQEYSYMAMPWSRSKQIARTFCGRDTFPEGYDGSRTVGQLNALFLACFRIQREASEAAGRYIPLVVENVKGAQPWVGGARWHYGSFYLWGDVPALMPITFAQRMKFPASCSLLSHAFHQRNGGGQKATLKPWFGREGGTGVKNVGGSWFGISHNNGEPHNPVHEGTKQGGNWWHDPESMTCRFSSRSDARKAASAQIAKIPFPLAQHIARVYKPDASTRRTDRQDATCL